MEYTLLKEYSNFQHYHLWPCLIESVSEFVDAMAPLVENVCGRWLCTQVDDFRGPMNSPLH